MFLLTFSLMIIVSITSNYWTLKIKKQARNDAKRAYQMDVLLETTRKIQLAHNFQDIVNTTVGQLQKICKLPIVFYTFQNQNKPISKVYSFPNNTIPSNILSSSEQAVAIWTFKNAQESGATTDTLPQSACWYLPIFGPSSTNNVIAVVGFLINKRSISLINNLNRNLLISILDECGQGLSRMEILKNKRETDSRVKQEKLRSTLLRGISHDLRTPLTNISGGADMLLNHQNTLTEKEKNRLFQSIFDDSSWLISLVENLLAMTSLESAPNVPRSPELVEDIITESLKHVSAGVKQYVLKVHPLDDLLMINVDPHLIAQVIVNLINNVVQHTPNKTNIVINAQQINSNQALFSIANDGPTLSDVDLQNMFNLFYTGKQDLVAQSKRGMGIGLSLCKTIIEAYGGKIWVKNLQHKGVCFYFTLPVWRQIDD